jgi:hypothetical protein
MSGVFCFRIKKFCRGALYGLPKTGGDPPPQAGDLAMLNKPLPYKNRFGINPDATNCAIINKLASLFFYQK